MALEECGGGGGGEVRARICANLGHQQRPDSRTLGVGGFESHEETLQSFDELRQTSGPGGRRRRRCCCVNINGSNRHRRRASGSGNLLTRSLVVNHVILMASLSFLFLLALFAHHQQQHHVAALKLPSFLASWIPQQQQQQQQQPSQQQVSAAGQLQDLVTAADLSGDHSSNLLSFAPSGGHQLDDQSSTKPKAPSSPLKRPFSGIGKHPIAGGHHHHHLFSALPKSLFGRILTGGGQQQTQQQAGGGAILSPMTRQQQQQLVLAMMANSQKYQPANYGGPSYWSFGGPAVAPSSGNSSQHASGRPHGNFINGNNQQHNFGIQAQKSPLAANHLMQQQQQHHHKHQPITSFRPIAPPQVVAATASGQNEPPKKHALGYGESDEDFVIVNAEQVPDLQRPPVVMQQQQHHQQQRRPLAAAAAVPTRHPSEEYREMPAIVIADPDDELVASLGLSVNANRTANATASGDHEQVASDLVKLKPPSSSQSNTTIATSDSLSSQMNQTAPSVTLSSAQVDGPTNTTILRQPLAADPEQLAASSFESQHRNSSTGGDTPESNRQESVASAVIVAAASNDAPQPPSMQHQEQPEQEALESFVLGPYKGLTLSDDELASPSSHQFQTQMESFIEHQQPQYSFPSYHIHQQMHHQARQQNNNNNQHQQQQQQYQKFNPSHSSGPQNLLGSASNLLQQARQLIQLPFTHLPHNAHLHQQHMPGQQQHHLHHNSQFGRPQLMHRPQQHWPSPMYGMPAQPQQQVGFYQNFQQQPRVSSSMRSPQVHQPNAGFDFGASNNQRPPAYYFEGQNNFKPAQPAGNFPNQDANFNLVVNHGARLAHQPSSAYFVDSTHQQQQLPAWVAGPTQHGQDSHRQHQLVPAELNSNETGGRPLARPPHFTQQMMQTNNKHKSGLYQIEPPKLESAGDKIEQQQQQLAATNEDDSAQQQQKIDVQENASDEELGGGGADDDDEQQQDISQQLPVEQQENEQRGEQQHQTQQMIAVAEPAADQQRANFSQQSHHQMAPPNQILQVGASFGVTPNFTASSVALNQSEHVAVHEGRRGQVFNESLGSQQHRPQQQIVGQPDHDITTAYEFRQQQAAPEQQTSYLDTQVYTLPYTMTVQNQVASFVPQQPRPLAPIPTRSHAPQQSAIQQQWQQQHHHHQQQQLPVTFIRTGDWEGPRQQALPVAAMPSWANVNNGQIFHHYQPAVDQTNNVAAQASAQGSPPQQFAFAVQHQPSELAAQTPFLVRHQQQQHQVRQGAESAAPSGEHQQQQHQDAVSMEPATSNSDQMASSSTTTPSSRVDDSGLGGFPQMAQDFAGPSASQQGQQQQTNQLADLKQQQEEEQQDRKSQQPASSSGQTKQVAPRSPSSFCAGRASGLYADVEQRCKAYYQCAPTGHQMFQCNNQTQFNQKTQNCDWWYNVDCGGRLGSPEDFEQASPSSPRSQLASMDQESATPASASATPSFSLSGQADLGANNQQQQQQQQQSSQADLRSFVEPPSNSTLAYNTAPPPATTTQMNVPNATTQLNQQQQQQQQLEAQATTTSTADDRTQSSLQQFSERSSTTPAQGASAGSRITSEQQQRQLEEADQQTGAGTTASSNQLIEVVNSVQTDEGSAQPRVGSWPNDDTPSSTSQATPTPTTQQSIATTMPAPLVTTTTGAGQQTTDEQAQQNEVTTQRDQQQQQQQQAEPQRDQISQVEGPATGAKPSARRFIQSEFGGSTKTARAISQQLKLKQQQQVASTGDLLAVDAGLPGVVPPLQDEMSQLRAQVEQHHSVRLGSAADVGNSQTTQDTQPESQPQIYSTSANQGSISYDPQAGVRDQRTIDMLGEFSPPARMGLASSRTASEPKQQEQSTTGQPARTLERRFGARLPATSKRH